MDVSASLLSFPISNYIDFFRIRAYVLAVDDIAEVFDLVGAEPTFLQI